MGRTRVIFEPDLRWDRRYAEMAELVGRSWGMDDGAVIADANGTVAIGYFWLPRGMRESPERLGNADFMSAHGVGAVERALLQCRHMHTEGPLTLYYWPRCLSLGDARLAAQAGIYRIVIPPTVSQRDLEDSKPVRALLREAGIRIDIVSTNDEEAPADE